MEVIDLDDKVIVNGSGLQQVSSQLASNSEKLYSIYSSEIIPLLNSCEEELKVSGLDYSVVSDSFKQVFTRLHSRIDDLVNALNNTIIPEYESTAQSISKIFNTDFANKVTNSLNIMTKD